MQLAAKGFDGLELQVDNDSQVVTAAVIFEDKATSNPRDTIRDEVWPEFTKTENGARDNILTAEVVALLRTRPALDPDRAIQNVIWGRVRHYRISITVGATHRGDEGRRRLFRGYDTAADGSVGRRRGEVLEIINLRPWMTKLAERAIGSIHDLVAADV